MAPREKGERGISPRKQGMKGIVPRRKTGNLRQRQVSSKTNSQKKSEEKDKRREKWLGIEEINGRGRSSVNNQRSTCFSLDLSKFLACVLV